jgi:putative polyhydroxyalkanoate system protein
MANEIRIHRPHALGLARARKLAWDWAERVERDYGMECTVIEGEDGDTVAFTRAGVAGEVIVAADHFDVQARLGMVFGMFGARIEAEIERQFDELLGAAAKAAPRKPAPAKAAPKKSVAAKRR